MVDLSGPKIRVGELTAPIELERGKMVVLARRTTE
jgi:pyruvate kinase